MSGYQIYAMLLTISSIGVPNAISKLISERVAVDDYKGAHRILKIGFATFYNVIIKSVEPTFSKTMSVSLSKGDKLYPCRADLSISMTTMEVATTDMIVTMEKNN